MCSYVGCDFLAMDSTIYCKNHVTMQAPEHRPYAPENPSHYRVGEYELMDVLEAWGMDKYAYRLIAAQYILRAHLKHDMYEDQIHDLKKAIWYLQREIDKAREQLSELAPKNFYANWGDKLDEPKVASADAPIRD